MKAQSHFKFVILLSLIFFPAWVAVRAQQTNRAETISELRAQIAAHLAQPRFARAAWGVKVVSLDSGQTIFEDHADRLLSPASNSKLYTTAMALDMFGSDYRIKTPIFATTKPNRFGTVRGDLVVVGHGDPSWNEHRFGTNFWDIFDPFISVLTNAGVRRIKGDIVADASFFRGPPVGGSWTADDLQYYYGAKISALTLDDNYTQIRVEPGAAIGAHCKFELAQPTSGLILSNLTTTVETNGVHHLETYRPLGKSLIYVMGQLPLRDAGETLDVTVARPAKWFATALKAALARHGIRVSGKARCIAWPETTSWRSESAVELGEVLSPPLRDIVRGILKPSQNLEDDLLFDYVGESTRESNSSHWETSEELGVHALDAFLAKIGVPRKDVQFDEGSGLSRNNLTTAEATVRVLQYMATNSGAADFMEALPIAGVDGTLRRRMKNTPVAGNLHGKTGSLRWASSLSGYVTSAAGEHLAFSLMLNRYVSSPQHENRDQLDKIAVMLSELSERTTEPAEALEQDYSAYGKLILTQMETAPFPHPARADGHEYHGKLYSAKEHYSDSTVALFVPKDFRDTSSLDFIVHFHGWNNSVESTLKQYKLIQQVAASGRNAVLVIPEGPKNAPDSFGGKLEDTNGFRNFMNEVIVTLRTNDVVKANAEIGKIILSGHSGGYEVMTAILDRGGLSDKVREVWLFDALYGGTQNFVDWQRSTHGRFLDIYTDHGGTKGETEKLMASLKQNGVSFFSGEAKAITPTDLRTNKWIFLHSELPHNDVVAGREIFEQFLETSCVDDGNLRRVSEHGSRPAASR